MIVHRRASRVTCANETSGHSVVNVCGGNAALRKNAAMRCGRVSEWMERVECDGWAENGRRGSEERGARS